jgi:hypothetical protein
VRRRREKKEKQRREGRRDLLTVANRRVELFDIRIRFMSSLTPEVVRCLVSVGKEKKKKEKKRTGEYEQVFFLSSHFFF